MIFEKEKGLLVETICPEYAFQYTHFQIFSTFPVTDKIISLDIALGKPHELDISGFFSIAETKIIGNPTQKTWIDQVGFEYDDIDLDEECMIVLASSVQDSFGDFYPEIDLAESSDIVIDHFETLETLDLGMSEIMNFPKYAKNPKKPLRPKTVNLNPDLEKIPYGAIDMRTEMPIRPRKKYHDLYRRTLPRSLTMRRSYQRFSGYVSRKKRPILMGFATLLALMLPSVLYVKYSVEHGYNTLLSLRDTTSLSEVREKIRTAKGDFDRANLLFLPFSWIPNDMVDLAKKGTKGGQLLTRALDNVLAIVPTDSGSLMPNVVVSSEDSLYRAPLKDIFLLENLGISAPTDFLRKNENTVKNAIDDIRQAGKLYASVRGDSHHASLVREVGSAIGEVGKLLE